MANIAKLYLAQRPAADSAQMEIDLDSFNDDVRTYLLTYALDVIRQRTYAKEGATEEDVRKRFEALLTGDLPTRGGGIRIDPVEKEFRELLVKAALKLKVLKSAPKVKETDWDDLGEKVNKKRQGIVSNLRKTAEQVVKMRDMEF